MTLNLFITLLHAGPEQHQFNRQAEPARQEILIEMPQHDG